MSQLFSPFTLGDLTLPNRIVMAPMTRCRATSDHTPTDIMATYYAERASGGLLITEGIAPDANGCGYARIPGLWSDAQVAAWMPITAAVHDAGGRIFAQLMHTGRVSHPDNMPEGSEMIAPSDSTLETQMWTDQAMGMVDHPPARGMTAEDIETTIEGFVTATRNAIAAGFDGVELHGANGYLIEQFIAPNVNQRDDDWGGDIAGRGRFALEVARRCADAVGASKVGIRLSPFGVYNGIELWDSIHDDYAWLCEQLGALGLAYVHVVDHSDQGAPEVPWATKGAMKDAFGGAFVLSGGYTDAARAEADLAEGRGDLVAYGKAFLANPDLPARLKTGAELNAFDANTFFTPGEAGYTDYPTMD